MTMGGGRLPRDMVELGHDPSEIESSTIDIGTSGSATGILSRGCKNPGSTERQRRVTIYALKFYNKGSSHTARFARVRRGEDGAEGDDDVDGQHSENAVYF